jgi:hypothetical protein
LETEGGPQRSHRNLFAIPSRSLGLGPASKAAEIEGLEVEGLEIARHPVLIAARAT